MGRMLICLLLVCHRLAAADLDLSLGFRDLAWGTSRAEIAKRHPVPVAEFSVDQRTIYLIEPKIGLVMDDQVLSGVICGNLLSSSRNLMDRLNPEATEAWDATRLTDSLSLAMDFTELTAALGVKKPKPQFMLKKRIGIRMCVAEFSRNEHDEYRLYMLTILPVPQETRAPEGKSEHAPQINF